MAEIMHPAAVKVGKHHDTAKHPGAVFAWGTESGKELEELCPDLELVRENSFNDVMKTLTFRGWLFGALPNMKKSNNSLAVFHYRAKH